MNIDALTQALEQAPTPFYLFDEAELDAQVGRLRALFAPQVQLCYAMKANSFVLSEMARRVERIEVCSPGEARSCFALGVPEEKMVISGVYKDPEFIDELVAGHPHIGWYTAESCAQFELLAACADRHAQPIRLLVRLTSGNQFGVTAAEAKELARRCAELPLVEFCGIQYFSGTQKTSLKRLKRELASVDKLAGALAEEGIAVHEVEFGPGLPVSYYEPEEDARAQQEELARGLQGLIDEMAFDGLVTLELGRALAASCGTYATRVVDTKRNKTGNYAIVDGGKHQFVYYGNALSLQLPPCVVLPTRESDETEPWNICGALCTVTDIMAKQLQIAELKVGDVLAFDRAGAYCMTEGISLFLTRDLPRVLMRTEKGELRELRGRIETDQLNTPQQG